MMELLDFWAPWCGPCRAMKPVVEELKRAYPHLTVREIDVNEDEGNAEAKAYGIQSIPCFVVLKDGAVSGMKFGKMTLDELTKFVFPPKENA